MQALVAGRATRLQAPFAARWRRGPVSYNASLPSGETATGERAVDFSSQQFADVVVAAPAGRIDHPAAQALENALLPLVPSGPDAGALLIDFAGVDYISSAGLRVLMVAAKQSRARGTKIGVAGLKAVVGEIFAISRFDAVLDIYPSVRDALPRFSAAALVAFERVHGRAP